MQTMNDVDPAGKEEKAPAPRNGQGFSLQLFWLILLPLIAFLLVIVFRSYSLHNEEMRTLVGDRNLRAVRTAAVSLADQLGERAFNLKVLAQQAGGGLRLDNLDPSARLLVSDFDGGVALLGSGGELIAANQDQPYWKDLPHTQPDFWQAAGRPGAPAPVYSAVIPVNGTFVVLTGLALDDGRVLIGAFSPSLLAQHSLSEFVSSGMVTALLVDQQRRVLYQVGTLIEGQETSSHPGIAEALRGESGINYYPAGHDEHVVAFSPVAGTGWGLVMVESWMEASSPLLSTTQAAPLVLVPVLLFVLVVLWFGVRMIVRPIQKLGAQAAQLGRGDFEAVRQPVGGVAEIRNLQEEFQGMALRLKAAQENLRGYIGAITAGVENERRSLARELHDDTLQSLIALNQRIQMSKLEPNGSVQNCDDILQMANLTINNLRRMVGGLRPAYLEDLGLPAALGMLAKETATVSGLKVKFNMTGNEQRLPDDVELALYRIAQEALNNAARHSKAERALLEIVFGAEETRLVISDDGRGFEVPARPDQFAAQGHFGLLGIHERADLIGARVKIDAAPGKGSRVEITYRPLK
jgi:signal transduction histidine kinase